MENDHLYTTLACTRFDLFSPDGFRLFFFTVIILVIPRDELRSYMLRAYNLGMTGGDYQFLYTDPSLADSLDIDIITSDILWKKGDNYDTQARGAFENVLYVSLKIYCLLFKVNFMIFN